MNPTTRDTPAALFFRQVYAFPKTLLILGVLVLVVAGSFLPRLQKDTRAEAFMPADHPVVLYRRTIKDTFGLADPMVVAVVDRGAHGVFDPESLRLVAMLTDQIAAVPGIDPDRVTSLATENNIVGDAEGMRVEPFFDVPPTTQDEADRVRDAIMDFPLYVGNLVAADGSATVIVAELLDQGRAVDVYRDLLAIAESAPVNGEEIHVAGEMAVSGYLGTYIDSDVLRLNPVAVIIISTILFLAYRTVRGVLLPDLLLIATVVVAIGTMAGSGVPYYVITSALPVVLIAIAVADGIHILGQYYEELAHDPGARQSELVVRTMVEMWRPVTFTSITDMAGFLAIHFASFMPPMKAFGLFAAIGVGVALLFALFVIPAALMFLRPRPSSALTRRPGNDSGLQIDLFGRVMGALGRRLLSRPLWILSAGGLVVAVGVIGACRLEINEERIRNFRSTEPLYQADRALNTTLNGTSHLDIVIETDEPEALFHPAHLRRIAALQEFVESLPRVTGSTSVVDYLKQMNRAMNANRADAYALPDDEDLIAQYFLLYEATGSSDDYEEYVDYDYRLANVRVTMNSGLYTHGKVVVEAVERYIHEQFDADGIRATLSGRVTVDYHWLGQLRSGHFRSVTLALLAVWLVSAFSFRSVVAGVLSVVPVTMAVLMLYGIMGYANVWLGVGTSMFAPIAIGTGIDFSIHTVDRLTALVRSRGESLETAFAEFFPSTGRALLFNFSALFFGFGLLMTSHVPPLVRFGCLVAVGVLISFLASLTVLPALILVLRPKFLLGKRQE